MQNLIIFIYNELKIFKSDIVLHVYVYIYIYNTHIYIHIYRHTHSNLIRLKTKKII